MVFSSKQHPAGFNADFYLHKNPDVAAVAIDPFVHYQSYGWREGRDPAPDFSTNHYIAKFSVDTFRNVDPLTHYNSLTEQVSTHPVFNRIAINAVSVAIVIVTYNCSDIAILTCESLRRTNAGVPWTLYLLDGGSRDEEKAKLKEFFEKQSDKTWFNFLDEDLNRGFSGSNNVAIKRALEQNYSHVCLLNPDVIVCDGWLADLVRTREIVIAPVSNAVGNEQTVPINYEAEKNLSAIGKVAGFANSWRRAFSQKTTYSDFLGFFCTVFRREIFEVVGFLDETFYPGGFEDLDFCLRITRADVSLAIARNVFLHHWGSSSFSTLPMEQRLQHVSVNRERYEIKHQRPWVDWAYRIPLSASDDARRLIPHYWGAIRRFQDDIMQKHWSAASLAIEQVGRDQDSLLAARRSNFKLLEDAVSRGKRLAQQRDILLAEFLKRDPAYRIPPQYYAVGDLRTVSLLSERPDFRKPEQGRSRLLKSVVRSVGRQLVLCQRPFFWAIEALKPILNEMARLLESGASIFITNQVDPIRSDERDGYVQRIMAIDQLCADRPRAYVTVSANSADGLRFTWLTDTIVSIEVCSDDPVILAALNALIADAPAVYVHSVLALGDKRLRQAVGGRLKPVIVDIHGSVPEEFLMNNDRVNATLYSVFEREISVDRRNKLVCVTNSMASHLQKKLGVKPEQTVTVPIFATPRISREVRAMDGRPLTIYAGGNQLWQRIPDMARALRSAQNVTDWLVLCPHPESVAAVFLDAGFREAELRQKIRAASHAQVLKEYEHSHFGLLVRAKSTVNRVACPTKMIEYLAFGIIPVLDFAEIGDFGEYGVEHLSLDDFAAGKLPSDEQRIIMVRRNWDAYDRICFDAQIGRNKLMELLRG